MGALVAIGAATAITATTVLESVAVVGAVVGAVGAVTKNKTLSMIGLGLGLVGGVGALATSALGIGSAGVVGGTEAAGAGAAAGGADVSAGAVTTMDAAEAAANPAAGITASAASGAAPDIVGDLASQVPGGDVPWDLSAGQAAVNPAAASVPTAAVTPGGDVNVYAEGGGSGAAGSTPLNMDNVQPGQTGTGTGTSNAAAAPSTATNPTAAVPNGTGGLDPGQNLGQGQFAPGAEVKGLPSGTNWNLGTNNIGDSSSGMLSSITGFVEKHPTLAFGALQAGGSALSGLTSTLTPAQVSALNAQAAANNAAAALATQQAANLNAPKSVAQSAPVTGTPPLVPGQQGLINRASQPVTGLAA